jgi:multidrug efflux pump subunit AcrA (membrane-fusion protein)
MADPITRPSPLDPVPADNSLDNPPIRQPGQPLDPLDRRAVDARNASAADTAPGQARAKLRAFEDANLGKRAVRSNFGHVERGFGSPFKAMIPEKHAEYAALEKLVEAEDNIDKANADLSNAKVAHDTALANLAVASKKSDEAAAVAKKADAEDAAAAAEDARVAAAPPVEGFTAAPPASSMPGTIVTPGPTHTGNL